MGGQPDAALSLCLQKAKALGLWIHSYRDHIVTAHRHVTMIFPAQSLDRCKVAAAVYIDPFGGVDFTEITGPNHLSGRKFTLDQRGRSRLAKASESLRNLFFSCVVIRYNFRRCFDTGGQVGGFSSQKTKLMIADDEIFKPAPVVELNHLLSPSSCTPSAVYWARPVDELWPFSAVPAPLSPAPSSSSIRRPFSEITLDGSGSLCGRLSLLGRLRYSTETFWNCGETPTANGPRSCRQTWTLRSYCATLRHIPRKQTSSEIALKLFSSVA